MGDVFTQCDLDQSNVMCTFLALYLHQLTNSKVQLYMTNRNNHKSYNLEGLLLKGHRGDREFMADRILRRHSPYLNQDANPEFLCHIYRHESNTLHQMKGNIFSRGKSVVAVLRYQGNNTEIL